MAQAKGAPAPFFLNLHSPRLRDDALLSRAIEALQAGQYADALLAVEYVCRRYPAKSIPAILRAKILQACRPELAAKAWYRAWVCDPENAMLQDALLHAWLSSGAAASVLDLGPAFLPERCRVCNHGSLIALLRQANAGPVGACWKAGNAIEGMLFSGASAHTPGPQSMRLIVADETSQFQYDVPADGRRFELACPLAHGVWSLAFMSDAASQSAPQLLQGSPLVFGTPAAATKRRASKKPAQQNPVAIVIAAYRDHALVKACIDSVLASLPHNAAHAELIVIDDASPEPALSAWLAALAQSGRITLLRNRFNLGFIESANRGLRHHAGHDALLLNADALVHSDWIDRLRTALYSAPDIASVTPWSNNGEISSFPKIATAAPAPALAQLARIDDTAASLRRTDHTADVELPACCGFAMLLRRSVLDQIGLFDGTALKRGYGEEVDWCLRARAAGYRHLAATGVFVAHAGAASFRFEKTLRVRQNRAVLAARYPHYYSEYQRFIRDDPLKAARQVLRAALEQPSPGLPHFARSDEAPSGSEWLARAVNATEGQTEFARALPSALPASCTRIAVWQHRLSAVNADKVLTLARLIARQHQTHQTPQAHQAHPAALSLRLLIIGEASEALWHSGVVDVLPSASWHEAALLTDAALIGLSGCAALLTESTQTAPNGIDHIPLDANFEPQAWLDDWQEAATA